MLNIFHLENIPSNLIFLLLLLPVAATIVAIVRQIIGIKMISAFAPLIAMYAFLGTGLIPGIIISLIIFISTILLRLSTRSLRIHYLPRISLLITLVTMILLILLTFSNYFSIINITSISAVSVILFILLSDLYLTAETQKGYKQATRLYIETIITALVIYFLASWPLFQSFLIAHPETIVLCIIIDLIIGRWKGLRLIEVYRFRSIIKEKAKDYA